MILKTLKKAALRFSAPPHEYRDAVFDCLLGATRGLSGRAYKKAYRAELEAIRVEEGTVGSALHRLLTNR